jgi:DNA-binding transcriptional MerR regulator
MSLKKREAKKKYKTNEICDICDISKATLFRWEKEKLITNVGRDWRNWRLYTDANIHEIKRLMRERSNQRGD